MIISLKVESNLQKLLTANNFFIPTLIERRIPMSAEEIKYYAILKDEKSILSASDCAEVLGISYKKMLELINKNLISSFKVGSNHKISKVALINYLITA